MLREGWGGGRRNPSCTDHHEIRIRSSTRSKFERIRSDKGSRAVVRRAQRCRWKQKQISHRIGTSVRKRLSATCARIRYVVDITSSFVRRSSVSPSLLPHVPWLRRGKYTPQPTTAAPCSGQRRGTAPNILSYTVAYPLSRNQCYFKVNAALITVPCRIVHGRLFCGSFSGTVATVISPTVRVLVFHEPSWNV